MESWRARSGRGIVESVLPEKGYSRQQQRPFGELSPQMPYYPRSISIHVRYPTCAMAVLSFCSVLTQPCDASSISSSCLPNTASMKSPKSVVFMSGARASQRKQRCQEVSSAFSRRDVIFTSLSAIPDWIFITGEDV